MAGTFTCPVFILFSLVFTRELIHIKSTFTVIASGQDFQFGILNGLFKIGLRFSQLQIILDKNDGRNKNEHHLGKYDKEDTDEHFINHNFKKRGGDKGVSNPATDIQFFAKGASDWVWKKHINIILL